MRIESVWVGSEKLDFCSAGIASLSLGLGSRVWGSKDLVGKFEAWDQFGAA